ncbi:MAG TPA: methyltransferase domain-containing protein, partial [Rhizomicrobium sp.]
AYRAMKRTQVVRALARHGLDEVPVALTDEVPRATRRRAVLKASKRNGAVQLGFRAARSHLIVDMQECQVLTSALVAILPSLRELLAALLGEGEETELRLTEAANGIDLDFGAGADGALQRVCALSRNVLAREIVRVTVRGEVALHLTPPIVDIAGVDVAVPSAAFLQPTREGESLLQEAVQTALTGATRVLDLFAGCGTFTLALARRARVHAVDCDAEAIAALSAAARNAQKLKPVTVQLRDLFKLPLSPAELDRFQAAVLDPPRAGALALSRMLAASKLARVAYVSCNPETFARDARVLRDGGLQIEFVRPIDQFLWSSHIELVALLRRR